MRALALVLAATLVGGCTYFQEKKADDELRAKILTALNEDSLTRQIMSQLRITVHAGRVGVQGHVAGENQRRKVMEIVRGVEGVVEAIDSLTVDDGMNIGGGGMYGY